MEIDFIAPDYLVKAMIYNSVCKIKIFRQGTFTGRKNQKQTREEILRILFRDFYPYAGWHKFQPEILPSEIPGQW
jgi:hypothetical protein